MLDGLSARFSFLQAKVANIATSVTVTEMGLILIPLFYCRLGNDISYEEFLKNEKMKVSSSSDVQEENNTIVSKIGKIK
ncbi:hypothetical protein BW716_01150 [[Flexibacter] sp. ATCC 35208]|nr:hypothetical protein BW716_01150 [[Flexibacter] sp. ATCC 35208]